MPDEVKKTVHRRRRPQPAQRMDDEPPVPAEPMKIIVGEEDDEPDWVVSAGNIIGAASRRSHQKGEEPGADKARAASEAKAQKESHAVLRLKKKPAASRGEADQAPAGGEREQPGRAPVQRPSAKRTPAIKRTPA